MSGKRKGKRRISWFVLILAAVFIYFFSLLVTQEMNLHQANADKQAAEERLKLAQQENAKLREEHDNLQRLDYVEKIAREDLGMTRQGELPYSTGRK